MLIYLIFFGSIQRGRRAHPRGLQRTHVCKRKPLRSDCFQVCVCVRVGSRRRMIRERGGVLLYRIWMSTPLHVARFMLIVHKHAHEAWEDVLDIHSTCPSGQTMKNADFTDGGIMVFVWIQSTLKKLCHKCYLRVRKHAGDRGARKRRRMRTSQPLRVLLLSLGNLSLRYGTWWVECRRLPRADVFGHRSL